MLFEFLYVDASKQSEELEGAPGPSGQKRVKKLLSSVEYLKAPIQAGEDLIYPYFNEETGVSARFVAYQPELGDEVGLAFEMDLPRPTFFAFEALPAALCVAREARLSVEVLVGDGSRFYRSPSFEELLAEWRQANAKAALKAQETVYCQAAAATLEAMWEFAIVRPDLERRYGRQKVDVPELYPVVHRRTKQLGRMVDWTRLGRVALGESDWVRLVDPPDPLKDGAIYAAEELTQACKPAIRSVPQPVFHFLCEKAKRPEDLVEKIVVLPKLSMRSFERLEFHQIYDEEGLPLDD